MVDDYDDDDYDDDDYDDDDYDDDDYDDDYDDDSWSHLLSDFWSEKLLPFFTETVPDLVGRLREDLYDIAVRSGWIESESSRHENINQQRLQLEQDIKQAISHANSQTVNKIPYKIHKNTRLYGNRLLSPSQVQLAKKESSELHENMNNFNNLSWNDPLTWVSGLSAVVKLNVTNSDVYKIKKSKDLPYSVIFSGGSGYALYKGKDQAIGKGAFGQVKYAQNIDTGEWVAIKIEDTKKTNSTLGDIERERKIMYMLGRNYATAHRDSKGNKEYVVQPLLGNCDLIDLMGEKNITLSKKLLLFQNSLHAMAKIHQENIAHCDIKPNNIRVNFETNEVYIIDFNVSNFCDQRGEVRNWKCGTPAFMAPEAFRDGLNGKSADIYSLGLTLKDLKLSQSLKDVGRGDLAERLDELLKQMQDHDAKHRPTIVNCIQYFKCLLKLATLDPTLQQSLWSSDEISAVTRNMQQLEEQIFPWRTSFSDVWQKEYREFDSRQQQPQHSPHISRQPQHSPHISQQPQMMWSPGVPRPGNAHGQRGHISRDDWQDLVEKNLPPPPPPPPPPRRPSGHSPSGRGGFR